MIKVFWLDLNKTRGPSWYLKNFHPRTLMSYIARAARHHSTSHNNQTCLGLLLTVKTYLCRHSIHVQRHFRRHLALVFARGAKSRLTSRQHEYLNNENVTTTSITNIIFMKKMKKRERSFWYSTAIHRPALIQSPPLLLVHVHNNTPKEVKNNRNQKKKERQETIPTAAATPLSARTTVKRKQ